MKLDILVFGAHPDDVELGVSGTIIKYQDTQFDILTLSLGGVFEGSNPMDRRSEVCNAWADVNVKNCKCGKSSKHFYIYGRAKESELRGCSDV